MKSFFKGLFSLLPFKKELFIFLKKIYSPPESIINHLHFQGSYFNVKVSNGTDFLMFGNGTILENQVFWKGVPNGWEPNSMATWKLLSENSKVIFDVGANTGLFSLTAKSQNPDSDVYSFEPIPKVFSQLVNNINGNGFDIEACQNAVSNYCGEGFFFDDLNDHLLSVTLNEDTDFYTDTQKRHKINTDVLRLDTFLHQNEIENLDLIKIDAEYHDAEVLEGLGEYLKLSRPNIIIEVLNNNVAEKINELIDGLEYKIIAVDEKRGFTSTEKVEQSPDYNVLLLNNTGFKLFCSEFELNEKN